MEISTIAIYGLLIKAITASETIRNASLTEDAITEFTLLNLNRRVQSFVRYLLAILFKLAQRNGNYANRAICLRFMPYAFARYNGT